MKRPVTLFVKARRKTAPKSHPSALSNRHEHILASDPSPTARVRAALVGCAAFLVKPLSRGDVVRAIEACGIFVPKDERHC